MRSRPKPLVLVAALAAALLVGLPAAAHEGGAHHRRAADFDAAAALRISQAAVGRRIGDYRLRDRSGRTVSLARFRGRPLVISLIYTSCADICPTITRNLAHAVAAARAALGKDAFAVATIGFDTRADTPERMRIFARQQGVDDPDWAFLSADAATIEALTRDLGFVFFRSPKGFDHIAQTTVVDAQGRIVSQVYGPDVPVPQLVEPLKDLAFATRNTDPATLSGWLNRVRLFCTIYDPAQGRYRFDYSIFVALGTGLVSLGAVAVFLVRHWRARLRGPAV